MAGFTGGDQFLNYLSLGYRHARQWRKVLDFAVTAHRPYFLFQHGGANSMPVAATYTGSALNRVAVTGGASPSHSVIAPKNASGGRQLLGPLLQRARGLVASSVGDVLIVDLIAYYPTIDLNTTSTQTMTNSVAMPRYDDGAGLSLVIDVTTNAGATPATATIIYKDESDTSRTTTVALAASTVAKAVPTPMWYVPLVGTQGGIRSVTSIDLDAAMGAGVAALCLVRHIGTVPVPDVTSAHTWPKDGRIDPATLWQLSSDAALMPLWVPSAAATSDLNGAYEFIEGPAA